jgi:hypothetical protein
MRHCTGKGGLLAFIEVSAPACTSAAALGGAWGAPELSGGAIAGIVIGVVAAVVLLAAFLFVVWRRE